MAAPQSAMRPAMENQNTNGSLLFEAENNEHDSINNEGSSTFEYDDFPLDEDNEDVEECKEDYFDTHYRRESIISNSAGNLNNNPNIGNNNNAAWVQLLNLPPHHTSHGVPVGGMRRVSSCYFSIASNISNDGNNSHSHHTAAFHSPNPSYHNSSIHNSHHYSTGSSGNSVLSFEGRNASDFLLHDVLMNVFSFLDANSLASFSETGRRPNFEVFYFLELQLQRALLVGEGNSFFGQHEDNMMLDRVDEQHENDDAGSDIAAGLVFLDDGLNDNEARGENDIDEENESNNPNNDDNDDKSVISDLDDSNAIPSFEGSIAGTGVISRLSSLDNAMARKIVQTYLDSNTSLHAMPLSHSLAYFRQVLLRQNSLSSPFQQKWRTVATDNKNNPNNTDNMAKNARNMALVFTFLGAAYMHAQQGGDVPNMPPVPPITMPDPSDVMNEENMEVFKKMLKVGLAGGFFKAGKTMKERQQQQQSNADGDIAASTSSLNAAGNDSDNDLQAEEGDDNIAGGGESGSSHGFGTDGTTGSTTENNHASSNAIESNNSHEPSSNQKRSSSIGSLEELSQMMPRPSDIASRLYNAFASHSSLPISESNENLEQASSNEGDNSDGHENSSSPKRRHRSKRSHKTLRQMGSCNAVDELNYESISEEKKSAEPGLGYSSTHDEQGEQLLAMESESPSTAKNEEQKTAEEELSPEAIAHAMEHHFAPNPYDHPASSTASAVGGEYPAGAAASFFSFNTRQESTMSAQQQQPDSGKIPSGCVGAYANAVKTAAAEVTRLVKLERKTNFDSLSPDEQLELGVRFIDACTSDTKLHIVKDILQKHKNMDVDRFVIGTDDTETCALHAAAFNGAETVLQYLCGGIDERDPTKDCGLCDVNVRDANGWTALHFAAGANSVTSVRVLAENGARLTTEASNGYTPYHWAERLSNEEVAEELQRLGANNRFVGRWMFGGTGSTTNTVGDERRAPFVSFFANRFFAFSS